MGNLLLLRFAMGAIVVAWAALRPEAVGIAFDRAADRAPSATSPSSTVAEVLRRRSDRFGTGLLNGLLLLDGLYLAFAMYGTGGTQSPIRFLVYLDLVAVSLLASYRTGLKIALWDSLLLFVMLYAQAAQPRAAGRRDARRRHRVRPDAGPQRHVVLAVRDRDVGVLGAQRARAAPAPRRPPVDGRRRRRGSTTSSDPLEQSRIVLDGPRRALRLPARASSSARPTAGCSSSRTHGTDDVPTDRRPSPTGSSGRAWERREILPVKRLDADRDPFLASRAARRPQPARRPDDRRRPAGRRDRRRASARGGCRASSGASPRCSASSPRSPRSTCATPSCSSTSRTSPSATRSPAPPTGGCSRSASSGPSSDRPAERAGDRVTAVLFIDLDDFKVVNDTLGHAAGDALLVAVTERIAGLVRATDLVARLGGDEFAILTEDEPDLRARARWPSASSRSCARRT